MSRFIKISVSILILFFFIITADLFIFRGYFSNLFVSPYLNSKKSFKQVELKYLKLNIQKKAKNYIINFKNTSLNTFFVWTFRNDKVFFSVNDSVLRYQYRLIIDVAKDKNTYEYVLDCGTGAGSFTINPFENFTSTISHKQILNPYYWGAYHQNNITGDTINDLINNKPLLLINNRKNTFKIFDRPDITNKDSIKVQLYLPVFSYDYNNLTYVKSNFFKLSYKEIINQVINEKKVVFKQIKD